MRIKQFGIKPEMRDFFIYNEDLVTTGIDHKQNKIEPLEIFKIFSSFFIILCSKCKLAKHLECTFKDRDLVKKASFTRFKLIIKCIKCGTQVRFYFGSSNRIKTKV